MCYDGIYRNGCTDRAGLLHTGFSRLNPRYIRTLSQTLDLEDLVTTRPPQARYKQATVVGVLLTTPGDDGGRGQVLSTVDRRQLCVQQEGIGHEAASCGSVGVS